MFWPDELARALSAERFEQARSDPGSVDLLTWNIFQALETHRDPNWLAYRLQALGGDGMRPPMRTALWTGRSREPVLRAKPDAEPIEVAVRIESPDVLVLVDVEPHDDRLLELIDAGIPHARRLSKQLAVSAVSTSATAPASTLSRKIQQLRDPETLEKALPRHVPLPPVLLSEVSWEQLLRIFQAEVDYLRLGGQPVRAFLDHARRRGLL